METTRRRGILLWRWNPKGASSPGEARDLVNEFSEHLNGPTLHDQATPRILVELQKPENRDRLQK